MKLTSIAFHALALGTVSMALVALPGIPGEAAGEEPDATHCRSSEASQQPQSTEPCHDER